MRRVLAVARKEMYHILRDPRSLTVAVAMPIMMVLLFGYAINMDLKNVRVGILDQDRSSASADFITRMTSSEFILEVARLSARDEVEPGFRRGLFRAVLVIPQGFEERLVSEPVAELLILCLLTLAGATDLTV